MMMDDEVQEVLLTHKQYDVDNLPLLVRALHATVQRKKSSRCEKSRFKSGRVFQTSSRMLLIECMCACICMYAV